MEGWKTGKMERWKDGMNGPDFYFPGFSYQFSSYRERSAHRIGQCGGDPQR
jgi:hypothetical protein